MDVLKQRCKTCNNIHPVRTTCPQCVEQARAKAVALAGPRKQAEPAYESPWEAWCPQTAPGSFVGVNRNVWTADLQPELTGAAKLEADCHAIDEWVNAGFVSHQYGLKLKRERLGLVDEPPRLCPPERASPREYLPAGYPQEARDLLLSFRGVSGETYERRKAALSAEQLAMVKQLCEVEQRELDRRQREERDRPRRDAMEKWCRDMGIPVR